MLLNYIELKWQPNYFISYIAIFALLAIKECIALY